MAEAAHAVQNTHPPASEIMKLSRQSLETLIDLVEIKLSCIEIFDRDDAREVAGLERCLVELNTMARGTGSNADAEPQKKRRGRRPKTANTGRPPLRMATVSGATV